MPHATRNQKDVQQIGATCCRFLQIRCGYRRITKAIDQSHLPLGLSVLVSSSVTGRTAALSQPKSLLLLRENVRINSTTRYFYVLYLYIYIYIHAYIYSNVLAMLPLLLYITDHPPPPPHIPCNIQLHLKTSLVRCLILHDIYDGPSSNSYHRSSEHAYLHVSIQ